MWRLCIYCAAIFWSHIMPRVQGDYTVQRRSKKNKSFILTINPQSGLPPEIISKWQRKSFSLLPPELSTFREPTSKIAAGNGAKALIELLRKECKQGTVWRHMDAVPIGDWLIRFTTLDNNPRAERLISEGLPYQPGTVDSYRDYYNRYIKDDPFLLLDLNKIDVPVTRAFLARIGIKRTKNDRELAGTRAYEMISGFVRMAFNEYWKDHQEWRNPFDRIKAPECVTMKRRDALQEDELLKLFMPGVITDVLERAVAVAMFWAGLRRAEIFGLRYQDLDWRTPKLNIVKAWKRFGSKKKRTIGDPKWHKLREAPFCEDLQNAIKILMEANGKQEHDYIFCRKDGSIPHGKWILEKLPKWMKLAGIEVAGRRIVPHSARHSLASCLENAGVPLRYIQEILGHSSLKTTKIYLHTPQGKINEITKKIEQSAAPKEEQQPDKTELKR